MSPRPITRERNQLPLHISAANRPEFHAPPEAENSCCMGAAFTDGERCTCWVAISYPEQEERQEGPMNICRKMCHDCAYRNDSPERADAGGAVPDYGRDRPFVCHQGTPITTVWVHPMTGVTRKPERDSYVIAQADGRTWLADGRPGEFCAGWAAVNRVRA